MKLVSKTNETKTVELTAIELLRLTNALDFYKDKAFELSNNQNHADAILSLFIQVRNIYCED